MPVQILVVEMFYCAMSAWVPILHLCKCITDIRMRAAAWAYAQHAWCKCAQESSEHCLCKAISVKMYGIWKCDLQSFKVLVCHSATSGPGMTGVHSLCQAPLGIQLQQH